MSNLDEKVDKLEEIADPNTVISVGGYNFTPAKMMVAFAIVSSTLGALYGVFEVYKDYQDMKTAIQEYTAPDLSELDKRIMILEQTSEKTMEFVRDINTTLRQDIRRVEGVLESVERSQKQSQRELDQEVKEIRKGVDDTVRTINRDVKEIRKGVDDTVQTVTVQINKLDRDTTQELRSIRGEVDKKIKQALDNPLAN